MVDQKILWYFLLSETYRISNSRFEPHGLCALIRRLWYDGELNDEQYDFFVDYFSKHLPVTRRNFFSWLVGKKSTKYAWKCGDPNPRQLWIEEQLRKIK